MVRLARKLIFLLTLSFSILFSLNYSAIKNIDTALLPYVILFEEISGLDVLYPVTFVDMDWKDKDGVDVIGRCIDAPAFFKQVIINKKFFIKSQYYAREELILHELGHCSLSRDHIQKEAWLGGSFGPVSIMYHSSFGDTMHYVNNRQTLLEELIQGQ